MHKNSSKQEQIFENKNVLEYFLGLYQQKQETKEKEKLSTNQKLKNKLFFEKLKIEIMNTFRKGKFNPGNNHPFAI